MTDFKLKGFNAISINNWYWARGQQQFGPANEAELGLRISTGEIRPDDLVWNDSMPQWATVDTVVQFRQHLTVSATAPMPVEIPAHHDAGNLYAGRQEVDYYNPAGGMPPRAVTALNKHARPLGDTGDWPLDDARVQQILTAFKIRKKITSAASFFRLCYLLTVLSTIILFLVAVGMLIFDSGRNVWQQAIGVGFSGLVSGGFATLYYFTGTGTQRSQPWAPLTMGILFCISGLFSVFSMVTASAMSSRGGPQVLVPSLIVLFLTGVFSYIAFRAFASIPAYRRQPAWCQEVLAGVAK